MVLRRQVNAVVQRVSQVPPVARARRRIGLRARTEFYGTFVKPDDLVFDVGAHVGNRTAAFLALGARVVAVEPQPRCIAELRRSFGNDERLTIVPSALGASEGAQPMFISNASMLSSMSPEFMERTRESGRFSDYKVVGEQTVATTTLDALVAEHGSPRFCKIDVEGYEEQVLSGLSTALPMVSLEVVPERLDATMRCLDRLESLGDYRFNLAIGEDMHFARAEWLDGEAIRAELRSLQPGSFCDVYARLADAPR